MKSFVIIASVVLGAVGCGGGLESDFSKIKDKMCACSNKECAEGVIAEYKTWTKAHRDEAKSMSKDQLEKLDVIDKEYKECRNKARDAGKKDGAAEPAGSAEAAPAKP